MSAPGPDAPSYVGGFNIPMRGGVGRLSLDRPFARLELHPRRVSFRPRGPWQLVFQSRSLPHSTIQEAFPVARAIFGGSGLGLTCAGDQDYYFWTRRPAEVLYALEAAGVPVDWNPRHLGLTALVFGRGAGWSGGG
jgi:hypothetical protein